MKQTIDELVTEGTQLLTQAGIQAGRSEAELIIAFVLNEDKSYVLAHNYDKPSEADTKRIHKLFNQRAARTPMSYVLQTREFYGRDFKVDKRALTPRIETEIIVQQAIRFVPQNASAVDIGTGCGAIGLSLKLERPDLTVTATDVSQEALDLARENAELLLEKDAKVRFLLSDLFVKLPDTFDVIVANLPYVSRQADLMPEVQKEPAIALFGGDSDGLDLYRRFFQELPRHLCSQGYVFLESDPWQQPALTELAAGAGLSPIFNDYFILGFQANT